MTAMPEDSSGVYLARENRDVRNSIQFCFHRGCTRWLARPGFATPILQEVDCRTGKLLPGAVVVSEQVVYTIQCFEEGRVPPLNLQSPNFLGITRARGEAQLIIDAGRRQAVPARRCEIFIRDTKVLVETVS